MQVSPGFPFGLFWGEFLCDFGFAMAAKRSYVCGWKFCALRLVDRRHLSYALCARVPQAATWCAACNNSCVVRRPLIAGNCRLLTFIKTINKFTHIFSHQNVAFSTCTTCRKQRERRGQSRRSCLFRQVDGT